jgi:hypothetical protein
METIEEALSMIAQQTDALYDEQGYDDKRHGTGHDLDEDDDAGFEDVAWPSAGPPSAPPGILTPQNQEEQRAQRRQPRRTPGKHEKETQQQQRRHQHRQQRQHRIRNRTGGILSKTADHVEKVRRMRREGPNPEGTFSPSISAYSAQLKRTEPVHKRLFRIGSETLQRKRDRILHDSKYDWDTGDRLFHPKTNAAAATPDYDGDANNSGENASRITSSSSVGDQKTTDAEADQSVAAGERLYRNALYSRARLREKQVVELIQQERKRQQVKMSPQSRRFARKKTERELESVFRRLNTSGSGVLSFEELSSGMSSVYVGLSGTAISGSGGNATLPDVMFWRELGGDRITGEPGTGAVDLVTFISGTFAHLSVADPAWTPLQVKSRQLTGGEIVIVWCRAWLEALAIGGKTPYGHVPAGDARYRWRQGTKAAVASGSGDYTGKSFRERRNKLAYNDPNDAECTFSPHISQRSRELDRMRTHDGGVGGGGSGDSMVSRVQLMEVLAARKEERLQRAREGKVIEELEECTFSPQISHSERTLHMVRKTMDPSDRSRFAGHHARQHSPAYKRLHDEHEERRRNRTAKLRTEDLELLEHCSFQPNVMPTGTLTRSKASKGSVESLPRPDGDSPTTGKGDIMEDSTNLLAEFDGEDSMRMPWETATPKKAGISSLVAAVSPSSGGEDGDSDGKSRNISVHALKSMSPSYYASGVQDHTARIRKAREAKEAKEREMALMGKSTDYAKSLRMDKPARDLASGKNQGVRRRGGKDSTGLLMTPGGGSSEAVKRRGKGVAPAAPASAKPAGISIPPALRMRVQMATGESQMLEIYAGDSPAEIARSFSETHSLERSKETKLAKLIAANMARHLIPFKN